MTTTAATLAEHVRNLAAERPADVFAKFLFRGAEPVTITYEGLLREASRFANFYASREVRKQDVVLIILDHSPDVIYAHVGALLLGAIPSLLAFPSDKVPANVYWEQLRLIFGLCQPRLVLTYDPLLDRLETDRGHGYQGAIERVSVAKDHPSEIDPVPLSPDDVAVLQHSSGTTGMKKGVALSHRAVLNELRNYAAALRLRDTDHIVSWAPLYHDMGLMAGYLLPLCAGVRLTLISTFEWLGRPAMFLEAISKERGTVCWMPNFAYAFMAKTVPDEGLQDVDLTSLRALINAGEPISDENHQAFFERFKGYGLRASALATAYGMAENTLAVTQGGIAAPLKVIEVDSELFSRTGRAARAESDTRKRRRLVSSGTLLPNNEVRIVGDSGAQMDDGCLGEIWVRSDSMMRGYYRRPDLDEEAFSEGWYRTGDLGFLRDGELFVTGRKKDMMIIAGKNIYPQDVDEIASAVPGVYPGRVVAFSVPNEDLGTEDVVIMAETLLKDERQRWELKMKVSVAVWQRLECAVTEVVLCDHMTLLKSSSGKISRPANRELYLRGRDGGRRPAKKSKHYKLADRASRAEDTLVRVGDLLIGGAGFTVMAGPCAVESADQIARTAKFVREHGAHVLRGGVFKPRTSPYAFQGLGYDGLELLASAGQSAGLPIITEVMAPEQVRAIAEKADILQIGARNMQNFDLLRAVGKVYRPVLLKRGLSSTIEEWLAAAEYILAQGNGQVMLCERGIRTFESATRNTLDLSAVVVLRERTHLPVIVDPSHGTGKRSYVAPMAYAARACGAHGLLIEVHPDPEHALSDGDQSLTFPDFAALMEGLGRQRK